MYRCFLFGLFITSFFSSVSSYAADQYQLYFVRHAEKHHVGKDPLLTDCGTKRAEQLAKLLSKANIKAIYSTSYQRTMMTAALLSKAQNLPIKHYSPKTLPQLAFNLTNLKQNALIVGHSNTTPELISLLTKQDGPKIKESYYQGLWLLQMDKQQVVSMTELVQPMSCR